MKRLSNHAIEGSRKRPIVMDLYWPDKVENMPVVLFAHGYKGFKDWGPWELVAERFAEAGMAFIKFNFSFNGGTRAEPIDFPDEEAFGENNYTTEFNDLGRLIHWVDFTNVLPKDRMSGEIYLIGHSRGGGISILKSKDDQRVNKLVTWAAVSDFASRFPQKDELKAWKEAGVNYVQNKRTGQQLPHKFQFFEDFQKNKELLDIDKCARAIDKPWLIVHAKDDEAVSVSEARSLRRKSSTAETLYLDNGGHTFGSKHPWENKKLPQALSQVVDASIRFFQS